MFNTFPTFSPTLRRTGNDSHRQAIQEHHIDGQLSNSNAIAMTWNAFYDDIKDAAANTHYGSGERK